MQKLYKSFIAAILAFAVLTGCSSSAPTTQATESAATQSSAAQPADNQTKASGSTAASPAGSSAAPEPITLKAFCDTSVLTSAGVQNDPVSKHIAEVTGVSIDNIPGELDQLKVLIASGDLPDIVETHQATADIAANMIRAKEVLPLDDLVNQYAPHIKAAIPLTLKFSKMFMNAPLDDQNLYFIPAYVAKAQPDNPNQNGFVGFFTRWDVYKAVGSPTIKNFDDYLSVLKKMVDYQPKTKDGKNVYAFSGWTDWGLWPYIISYPFANGYNNSGLSGSLRLTTMEFQNNYLDPNSIFWQGIKFFYKANQMGLFDPEAFTMKYDQYTNKIQTGQVLVSPSGWAQPDKSICGDMAAMYIIPGTNPYISQIFQEDLIPGYMMADAICLSAKCKYPERAMRLLDYCNTDEGARWIYNGVKDVDWTIKNGKPELIGKMLENAASGGAKNPDYIKPGNVNGIGRYGSFVFQQGQNLGTDGYPLLISQSADFKILAASVADKDFAKAYGKPGDVYPGQAYVNMVANGLAKNIPTYPLTIPSVPSDLTELTQISNQADTYMADNLPKLILAKNDADFAAQQSKAIDDIKAMGMQRVADAEVKAYQDSKSQVARFYAN